ncbi:MAG: bifunctional pyr operon transcriptional regulator/uracil phosphoribosyltransferase PyrR [Lautropia sp.]
MSRTTVDAEALYATLLESLRERLARADVLEPPALIGVHSGGAWIAERLHRDLALQSPLGFLSSAFHRDDYGARGIPTTIKSTAIDFPVADRHILLVDDILYTGRTIRAALNEIFDYGRPARVELAVLLDRGGRELPLQADHVGAVIPLGRHEQFVLSQETTGRFALRVEAL